MWLLLGNSNHFILTGHLNRPHYIKYTNLTLSGGDLTDLRHHLPYDHSRGHPDDHYIQQYNAIHPPSQQINLSAVHHQQPPSDAHPGLKYLPLNYNNSNSQAYRPEHLQQQQPMYLELESGAHNNHKALHNTDSNGDYDETMSNNEDNVSIKDLSPGVENSEINGGAGPKGYGQSPFAENCDQKGKPNYDYAGNPIRARNFKEMQSPGDGSEQGAAESGGGLANNYMEGHGGEEVLNRLPKESSANGGNGLRTYPSSEDLNQTVSSDHNGEKITSGSDDEGECGNGRMEK